MNPDTGYLTDNQLYTTAQVTSCMEESVVLVVDGDEQTRLRTAELVREAFEGVSVPTANSVGSARDALENQSVDVIVTGYVFPDGNGLELAHHVRETSPGTGCILYTHSETVDTDSFEDVVVEFLGKETPDAERTLLALIEQAGPDQTQAAHPVPETEGARRDVAERIRGLEQRLSPAFDELTALAVDHFGATSAAVTLILREQQVPVSDTGAVAVPPVREHSLATHTIVSDGGVMAVPDTRADPRFSGTEEIQSAAIGSYLGAAIETTGGHAVGVISVYDDEKREFTATDRQEVKRFSAVAGEIIRLAEGGERSEQ